MISKTLEVIINNAIKMANQLRHEYLTLESILYVMVSDDEQVVGIIEECGADTKSIKKELKNFMSYSGSFSVLSQEQVEELSKKQFVDEDLRSLAKKSGILYRPEISMALHRVIQRAAMHVQQSSGDHLDIRGINILVAMFHEEESFALHTLAKRGIERLNVIQLVAHKYDQAENQQENFSDYLSEEDHSPNQKKGKGSSPLEHFCYNLNRMAEENKIDPLIGRSKELERIMQTLCRRRKNNPLLVGEAGVGKTAIAEGLAWVLVNNNVPEVLSGTTIFSLDMATLVAGAKFRGEFEQRLKAIIKNLEQVGKNEKRPVLFIDDIHTVIGAGATAGSGMDASNLLRPILAGGSVRVMGSTTYQEYRKFVEKDAAFGRRFQKIDIDEPNFDETYKILQGLRRHFEEHHGVRYSNKVLKTTVELANKYINERKNPDKSIDVIDEAGATVQLRTNRHQSAERTSTKKTNITHKDIETIVAKFAKLPRISVIGSERERLKELNVGLKRLIYGQDHAIDAVTDTIILSRSGLGHIEKPMGSFLFAGPTGVGKTELARQLAEHLGSHLERFDMSEYGEKHSISRLIGAPPGYVGHEEGGLLTDAVVKHPHCVVLLDEMEKAHPEIYNVLLQVMDYGKLTDTQGRSTDFRNVIIIMTTNAGAKEVDSGNIGLTAEKNFSHKRDQAIKNFFTPEFRNRLDEIIHFNRLNEEYILQIVDKFIFQLEAGLKEKQALLDITVEAKKWIGKKGFDPKMGAREISRFVDRELKKPLSKEILFGSLAKGGKVIVSYDKIKKKLVLKFEPSKNRQ